MIELDVPQRSKEWFAALLGNPGASNFSRIITSKGEPSKSQKGYLDELFDEIVSGENTETFQSYRMQKGIENERKSLVLYQLMTGLTARQTGLCYRNERKQYHCSPDALVDPDGGFESKDASPHVQLEVIRKGILPTIHVPQVQGSLFVTGRKWWDFQSYCENMQEFRIRVYPDLKFHKKLEEQLEEFCFKLAVMVREHKIMKGE